MDGLGYEQDQSFNALHGGHRLYFWDPVNERQVDVFLDKMEMCHAFDFSKRIDIDAQTLSLADLLLLKLQIVETNHKDYLDMLALFSDHDLTDDDDGINVRYMSASWPPTTGGSGGPPPAAPSASIKSHVSSRGSSRPPGCTTRSGHF